jgi:hypothetical protein
LSRPSQVHVLSSKQWNSAGATSRSDRLDDRGTCRPAYEREDR